MLPKSRPASPPLLSLVPPSTGPLRRTKTHSIVIVGGGAGGLELATRLGDAFRRHGGAQVLLIDRALKHLWKPLLHEVAAGSLDMANNEVDYLAHARRHHFQYQLGDVDGLDREGRQVWLAPLLDDEGQTIAPRRSVPYDTLVLALGSRVNDFGIPGVQEHAMPLNTPDDARQFHQRLFWACVRAESDASAHVDIAIIGAGATGVELATELRSTLRDYAQYAWSGKSLEKQVRITLIEAGPRILGALPDKLAATALAELQEQGIAVLTNQRVNEVTEKGVACPDGRFVPAQLVVWAAGIKGPELIKNLAGLEATKGNQLVVRPSLQTTQDERVFAMGDCASCILPGRERPVPPLAQAAQQQARFLASSLRRVVAGRPPLDRFQFHDRGSVISLGHDNAAGSIVGFLTGRRFSIQGLFAKMTYWLLYRRYLVALHGVLRMLLTTAGDWLVRTGHRRVKLH
ncbi:NAD(P)/FAD-dependent oxidoreductase [Aquabacterium sp.]|uniref:NAD(P)/FAD-dependent oxidoreductase n=1 Tax=Aquabacterium sp. TaxID=1872578 RepID=UPI003D6CFEC3